MACSTCVITLCGVPGSGKTSFSTTLKNYFESKDFKVSVISFDDHEIPPGDIMLLPWSLKN
jgi:uridine kinase